MSLVFAADVYKREISLAVLTPFAGSTLVIYRSQTRGTADNHLKQRKVAAITGL